jgi:hypothetical protein
MPTETIITLLAIACLIGILALVSNWMTSKSDGPSEAAALVQFEPDPEAIIREEIEITGWGWLSRVLLVLAVIVSAVTMADARNILQQIYAGVGFLGSAIVFGLGIALGRKRTYRVYRKYKPERPQS